MNEEKATVSASLPKSIGLALSGGGYRAAAFHLGAVAYLDRIGFLPAVRVVSTVSGGTFTGAALALARIDGRPFLDFFHDFYGKLLDVDLIRLGLGHLAGPAPAIPSRRHSLIISMAQIYAKTFFQGPDGEPYRFGKFLDPAAVAKIEVIFNATDFRHGHAFRFQNREDGKIGNFFLSVDRKAAEKIRLADIVAASSCFPGGFEPIAFPDDFSWPEDRVPAEIEAVRKFDRPVALMDGGVYDNQGTESLLVADRLDSRELDLFIISDVSQRVADFYPFPKTGSLGGLTLGTLNLLARLLSLTCALTAAIVAVGVWREWTGDGFSGWDVFRLLIPFLMATATSFALWVGRRELVKEFNRIPNVGEAAWRELKRLRLGHLRNMALLRISSLMAMASAIFMHRVRDLGYALIYKDRKYEGRRISNLIYHLQKGSRFFFANRADVPDPSPETLEVIAAANAMPTTLWFDDSRQAPNLVAAGQITLCYNLMKFITRGWGPDPAAFPPEVRALWDRLLQDWTTLQIDPHSLLPE